jgi:predicted kinase
LLIAEDHWTSSLYPDELRTIDDYARYSARLERAIAPLVVDILRRGISVVMDFHANTVRRRSWLRSLAEEANADHELHWLDLPDAACRQRLKDRNAGGTHPFQVSEAEYELFTRFFTAPTPDEGFTVFVHKS